MAIESICKGCARKLRVDDEYAGRKAKCPHCKTIYTVPAASGGDSYESTRGDDSKWLLRTKDGAVYGPAEKSELDAWAKEGRLDSASQVQKEGEENWQPATELYPSLLPIPVSGASPFANQPASTTNSANPYASPVTSPAVAPMGIPFGGAYRPHRGGLILTLSILGILCCQIFSVVAWIMGRADLTEIDAGRMHPDGRGLTQAGMIIGIIGTILFACTVGFQIIMMVFAVVGEM